MKDEIYQYSISIKTRSNGGIKPIIGFGKYFVLMFFSVVMLLTNVILWIMSFVVFVSLMLYERKENDEYSRALFDIGIFLLFISIYLACIPFRYGYAKDVVVSMIVGVLFYEVGVLLNIKSKKYSTGVEKFKKEPILGMSGCLVGMGIGRFISKNSTDYLSSMVSNFISIAFLIFSITFLQRYIFYKILKKYYN